MQSAQHQTIVRAKLRLGLLSVLELIAQILCAVVVQKSSEAPGNTHTCVLVLPRRRFLHKIAILRAEIKMPFVIARRDKSRNVAIKAKPQFATLDSYVAALL